ncbi:MAG TPA: energy-coupling factor transporter transmembrane component T [Candidatus Limnocylindria bacterium]|jgi:energy-coupling factor transport system permease protein|nr:energy-coupling factor transporter transmembrane component T [Candidatus Limnocylindria bacterium]
MSSPAASAVGSDASGLPAFVQPPPTGTYRSLNPTTKLVIALVEALIAFVLRGWTGLLVVLLVVAATALIAGVARAMLPFALATIPLIASIFLVNTFFFPGASDVITRIGPLTPSWSGLEFATQAALRVVAFALSVAVFGLTTRPDDLVADLERRGLGRRASFVVGATLRTVPRILQRAGEITEAQRARGMDTEGSILRRVRGVLPLAGPLIFGALTDVEEQAMALEARAFSAHARRTVLRVFPDSPMQRLLRWTLLALLLVIIVLSVSGALAFLP